MKAGFTLVEYLLYIAIVSAFLFLATFAVLDVFEYQADAERMTEIGQNARMAMNRMELAIRNADAVSVPVLAASSSMLILQMPNAAENPTSFFLESNLLKMKVGSSATTSLIADELTVNTLTFRNLSTFGVQPHIRIEMFVSSSVLGGVVPGERFFGSASVRKKP